MKRYRIIFKDGSELIIEATYASVVFDTAMRETVWQSGDTVIPMSNIKAVIQLS